MAIEQSEDTLKDIVWIETNRVKPHPKNRNKHTKDQIDRLCKIIEYQSFRDPLIISNRSSYLISGHARLQAAKQLNLKKVPVMFQTFESDDQEYAALVSENSIASWSELDLSGINLDIGELGPDFDIDLLGIKDFTLDPNFEPGTEDEQGQLDEKKPVKCPKCGEEFVPKT